MEDIKNHLNSKLRKVPLKDVILLYATTGELQYGDYHLENNNPIPDREEMIDEVIIKVTDEIKDVASDTFIPDFFSGETWEDEE